MTLQKTDQSLIDEYRVKLKSTPDRHVATRLKNFLKENGVTLKDVVDSWPPLTSPRATKMAREILGLDPKGSAKPMARVALFVDGEMLADGVLTQAHALYLVDLISKGQNKGDYILYKPISLRHNNLKELSHVRSFQPLFPLRRSRLRAP